MTRLDPFIPLSV